LVRELAASSSSPEEEHIALLTPRTSSTMGASL
jgi:hypothetical protein